MAQTVKGASGREYKWGDLEDLFRKAAPEDDWKGPISVLVQPEGVQAVVDAIEFYTATSATVEFVMHPGRLIQCRVESVGYRAGPAGP